MAQINQSRQKPNKNKATYICLEGKDFIGKSTQTQKLVDYLRESGYKVLQTKEPGTDHLPITMELRNFFLNLKYNDQLTPTARELIAQAIRSIHIEKLINPIINGENSEGYDFIIQDRGILSGLAYGVACGNSFEFISDLLDKIITTEGEDSFYDLYDCVIYLRGEAKKGNRTEEFKEGDAMESKGDSFMEQVQANMDQFIKKFSHYRIIDVDNKDIDNVFNEVLGIFN